MSILLLFSQTETELTASSTKHGWALGISRIIVPDNYVSKTGTWENELGSEDNLYLSVDEATPNDSDYIYDTFPTNANYYEFSLNAMAGAPPGDVVILWRGVCLGTPITIQIQLRQGENTVVASSSQALSTTMKTYYYQLTPAEKESISDWSDLHLRIIENIS